MVKTGYDRVDVTFSKNDELEKELYKYISEKGRIVGKGKYIKQLIYNDMKKSTEK